MAEDTEQTDEQAEQAGAKEPTPTGALPADLIAKTPPINAGKKAPSRANGKTGGKAPAAEAEPPADAVAIYERTGDAWALKKTYATEQGGIGAFQRAGIADDVDETRLVTRADGIPFTPTMYGHEVDALTRVASITR